MKREDLVELVKDAMIFGLGFHFEASLGRRIVQGDVAGAGAVEFIDSYLPARALLDEVRTEPLEGDEDRPGLLDRLAAVEAVVEGMERAADITPVTPQQMMSKAAIDSCAKALRTALSGAPS